jgi:hypothetical protein
MVDAWMADTKNVCVISSHLVPEHTTMYIYTLEFPLSVLSVWNMASLKIQSVIRSQQLKLIKKRFLFCDPIEKGRNAACLVG